MVCLIQEPKRKSWLKLRNWVYNLRRPGRQNGDLVNIANAKFVWKFMIALGRRSLMKPVRTMGAAVCAGALVAVALALSTAGQPGITLMRAHRHDPIQGHHRLTGGRNSTSTNWSGYAVTSSRGSVTHVTGSWTVPPVSCTLTPNGYSSFWVGIDGDGSNTVEQIGTDSDCVNLLGTQNTPTYYAWFEFYPKGSYLIGSYNRKTGLCQSNCVSVGDLITADVSYGSGGPKGNRGSSFTVTITDKPAGGSAPWSFSISSSVASAQQSSAEWIAEAPSSGGVLPLADFGSVTFSSGQATIGNTTGNIGSFSNPDAINMVNSAGVVIARTSVLDTTNAGFTITFVP